jgi:hypothetical protein
MMLAIMQMCWRSRLRQHAAQGRGRGHALRWAGARRAQCDLQHLGELFSSLGL